jgi:CubicO group peptidase (beta-lactamase class C family)
MTHHPAAAAAIGLLAAAPISPFSANTASAQPCDPSPIDAAVLAMLDALPNLEGAALLVGDAEGLFYEGYFGAYGPDTFVPLASASKLLSAVAVMTKIDSGEIDPHAPIVQALPELFAPQRAGLIKPFMTVDQMYSMTSGYVGDGGNPILGDLSLTMAEAVDLIATTEVPGAFPGTELNYTGLGMHVAGHLCEVLSGQNFEEFYEQAVSEPLNTPSTGWQAFGPTLNFRPSGGGESDGRDYARVLRMLVRGGELEGVRILSPEAVEGMYTERTVGLPVGDVPPDAGALGWGYAFGMWVEDRAPDGTPTVLTSPGAFGTTPWIDREDAYWGVLLVEGFGSQVRPYFFAIRDAVEAQLINNGCTPCPADLTHDGLLDLHDVVRFSFYGINGDERADLSADGVFDLTDIGIFVEQVTGGCG